MPHCGQTGDFTVHTGVVTARIVWSGLYGLCIPQFGANAVDYAMPFISNTGSRTVLKDKGEQ